MLIMFLISERSLKIFLFNNVKSREKIVFEIWFSEKCSILGVSANSSKKVPFQGPYWSWTHFYMNHSICLVELFLSTHMTIFWLMIFWPKKGENWSKLEKIAKNAFITHFTWGSYSQFWIWWILRNLVFFALFEFF